MIKRNQWSWFEISRKFFRCLQKVNTTALLSLQSSDTTNECRIYWRNTSSWKWKSICYHLERSKKKKKAVLGTGRSFCRHYLFAKRGLFSNNRALTTTPFLLGYFPPFLHTFSRPHTLCWKYFFCHNFIIEKKISIVITYNDFTVFENHPKCLIWILAFWHFSPIFVLLKLTYLVTLFDRKLQFFKNSSKFTIFGILL